MSDKPPADPQFNTTTARLLRREALRRAAEELSTMSAPGLEQALARISAEVTEEAVYRQAADAKTTEQPRVSAASKPPERE